MRIAREEIVNVPVHSYVKVIFVDGSRPDYFVVRSASIHDGARNPVFDIMGGSNWDAMAKWDNVEFEVMYSA